MSHIAPQGCAEPGCPATYMPHRWGAGKAHADGWFLQRNGDAWCPDHTPDWVDRWRARQTAAASALKPAAACPQCFTVPAASGACGCEQ